MTTETNSVNVEVEPAKSGSTILLDLYHFELASNLWKRFFLLGLESFVLMGFAIALVVLLKFPDGGTLALFFCSASLLERHHEILNENRRMIWSEGTSPWRANSNTAISLFAIFCGIVTAHLVCSGYFLWTGQTATYESFYALMLRHFIAYHHLSYLKGVTTILYMVLAGNFLLIGVLFFMGFLFRVYGVILALGWGAYAWAIEWVRIFQSLNLSIGMMEEANRAVLLRAGVVTGPYLTFEVFAFVLSALAGVFLSRAVTLYSPGSAQFRRVFRACIVLLLAASGLALLACSIEVGIPLAFGF